MCIYTNYHDNGMTQNRYRMTRNQNTSHIFQHFKPGKTYKCLQLSDPVSDICSSLLMVQAVTVCLHSDVAFMYTRNFFS